jgi:glycosyltransferase involved in cell wall biosynthesis
MNKMKTIHIITGLKLGGAETSLLKLLTHCELDNKNQIVISLTTDKSPISEKIEMLGVKVIWLKFNNIFSIIKSFLRLIIIIREFKPVVIQGWMYHANIMAYISSLFISKKNKRLIWNIRHTLNSFDSEKSTTLFIMKLSALLSNRVDKIVYNSRESRKSHLKHYFSSGNSMVIHNGFVRISKDNVNKMRYQIRNENWKVGNSMIVIGHLGRFHKIKGHIFFIKCMCNILKNFQNIKIVMAGNNVCKNNQDITKNIPLQFIHNFILLDQIEKPIEFLSGLDIFCQTSFSEAFPNALTEAMSLGIFSIASNVGDTEHIMGDTEFIFKPNDAKGFIKSLNMALRLPKEERESRGSLLRERVYKLFSIGTLCKKYNSLLNSSHKTQIP